MRKDHAPQFSRQHPPMAWPVYKVIRQPSAWRRAGIAVIAVVIWVAVIAIIAHAARAVFGGAL